VGLECGVEFEFIGGYVSNHKRPRDNMEYEETPKSTLSNIFRTRPCSESDLLQMSEYMFSPGGAWAR